MRNGVNQPARPGDRVVRRELTAAEVEYLKRTQAEVEGQKDEYLARADEVKRSIGAGHRALAQAMQLLRAERNRQGLSLDAMRKRTGIARSALCLLEKPGASNPTIATVCRVAEAHGVGVEIRLVPVSAASSLEYHDLLHRRKRSCGMCGVEGRRPVSPAWWSESAEVSSPAWRETSFGRAAKSRFSAPLGNGFRRADDYHGVIVFPASWVVYCPSVVRRPPLTASFRSFFVRRGNSPRSLSRFEMSTQTLPTSPLGLSSGPQAETAAPASAAAPAGFTRPVGSTHPVSSPSSSYGLSRTDRDEPFNEFEYRPVPVIAPIALFLGLCSVIGLFGLVGLAIGVAGVVLGAVATFKIRRSAGELSGLWLPVVGTILSVVFLASGSTLHAYTFATEVPDGFERKNFTRDISKKGFVIEDGDQSPHPDVVELDGKKIFLKGYMYPERQSAGLQEFVLVKDNLQCCFGGQPQPTDMISVVMDPNLKVDYTTSLVSVAGVFRARTRQQTGSQTTSYKLEAAYFSPSKTSF